MTDLMGGLNRIFEWVMRLSVINLLWIGFNLPICYLALSLLYASNSSVLFMLLATIVVLAPFFFFPATTAMFGVVRKWVMGEHDVPLFKSYWAYYKENYVRSMSGGLIFSLIWVIWGVDFYFFSKVNVILSSIFLVGFFFLFLFALTFFANTVHADLKFFQNLKNSFFLTLLYPFNNILVVVLNGIIIYVSLTMFTFLIPFFMGSLIAFVSFAGYYQKVSKIQGSKKEAIE
ncbi:DUF624 domain-containing protein [Bacillus sp. SA1-12]|uniref:YesL family protein n=1 Tax=Bacillaceae TaxID=186817 RepID=UPI00062721FB|nr:DUF624 domain-containing protein [Bacillus sp. SA1-12]KKI89389.1 hypothetical protein WQ54_26310 [Bacillus sp. SA1-12]